MSLSSQTVSSRGFRRRTIAVFATVGLIASGLAAANLLQPPRITAVEFRAETLAVSDSARITVTLSEAVRHVQDVDVTAATPVTADSEGATVTLTVHGPLDYGAVLPIRIAVTSAATGIRGVVEPVVTAADTRVATLVRDDRGDRIMSDWLVRGGDPDERRLGRPIQEFASFPDRIFAITAAGPPDAPRAVFAAFSLGSEREIPLIAETEAQLSQLRAEPQVGYVGLVTDGLRVGDRVTVRELLLFDGRADSGAPAMLTDPEGAPLAVSDWRFVPGTTAVIVRDTGGALWQADPVLGGAATPITESDPRVGALLPEGGVRLSGGDRIGRTAAGTALTRSVGEQDAPFFTPAGSGSRIGAVCASPNGRAVAVEVISAEGRADGRAVREGFSHTTTVFLDARTGTQLRSVIGFAPSWC
ncbi:hypothetical protein EDF60_0691 [Leucobacter luti]|nr:hypothetical protein EDF60_0691 [Leucobacter luti]